MALQCTHIAPTIRLLVGCCSLLCANTGWGQQNASPGGPTPHRPNPPTVETVGEHDTSGSSTGDSAVDAPPSRISPQGAVDTWGTSAPIPSGDANPGTAPEPPTAPINSNAYPALEVDPSKPDETEPTYVRYHLERIEVRGNTRTRSSVILRYLPFREGKELDVDDVEFTLARYRLLGTGFFREVEFGLRKGSSRGNVVLMVDVVERNTVVVNGVWMGISQDADRNGNKRPLTAYGGVDVAETNLAGTGISLGGAVGLAQDQYALRVRFLDPSFLGTPWMVNLTMLHNRARDFFGTQGVAWEVPSDAARTDYSADYAVVPYQRFGGSVGVGRDLSVSTQLWFHYRLETITATVPSYATQNRGGRVENIDFDILQGRSVFSTVRANLQFDTRDHPFLPTRGWFFTTWGELGLSPLGSNYNFQRFDASASHFWHKSGSPHVFRLQLFAGAMTGYVPFFEQYYVGDFSDFLPARMLDLNVDRRSSPDYLKLGTAIHDVRYGHYAAQVAGEYRYPVYRGHRSVYAIDLFLRAGVFSVAHQRDLDNPAPQYRGFQRVPVDLTFNAGFRMDTSAGGVVFSLSNVFGLIPPSGGP